MYVYTHISAPLTKDNSKHHVDYGEVEDSEDVLSEGSPCFKGDQSMPEARITTGERERERERESVCVYNYILSFHFQQLFNYSLLLSSPSSILPLPHLSKGRGACSLLSFPFSTAFLTFSGSPHLRYTFSTFCCLRFSFRRSRILSAVLDEFPPSDCRRNDGGRGK